MVTDPIADMLARIMNASKVGKTQVVLPLSNLKTAVATVLKENGYLAGVAKKTKFNNSYLVLDIAYDEKGVGKMTFVKKISKSSRRIYEKADNIKSVRQGRGIAIVSTSQGVMTDKEARKAKIGGELICKVW